MSNIFIPNNEIIDIKSHQVRLASSKFRKLEGELKILEIKEFEKEKELLSIKRDIFDIKAEINEMTHKIIKEMEEAEARKNS